MKVLRNMLIIFDVDDTLIDTWNYSMQPQLKRGLNAMVDAGLQVDDVNAAFREVSALNDTTANATETYSQFVGNKGADTTFVQIAMDAYNTPIESIAIPFLDGAKEVVETLSKTHSLALVTHGVEATQQRKIDNVELDRSLFVSIIVSKKYDKKEHYQKIMGETGFAADKIVVIGDKFKSDLLPAKELGMHTVHMKWGRGKVEKNVSPEFSISHLRELLPIIEGLA
ncbi:hypothetical protein CL620_05340 [archaeon]|nr:hypothetical protein [archaeon]